MKKSLLPILLLLHLTTHLPAQPLPKPPFSIPANADSLAWWINANCKTERDKLATLYAWISDHIKYDKKGMDSRTHQIAGVDTLGLINRELQSGKAVCVGYAAIFMHIARKMDITSLLVTGYCFDRKMKRLDTAHAWVAVKTGADWSFVDPTWGAGYIVPASQKILFWKIRRFHFLPRLDWRYFMKSNDVFIKDHVPFDPLLQFSYRPVSHDSIRMKSRNADTTLPLFRFNDTLNYVNRLNNAEKALNEIARIRRYGTANALLSEYINAQRQNIPYYQYQDDKASGQYDKYRATATELTKLKEEYTNIEAALNTQTPDWNALTARLQTLAIKAVSLEKEMTGIVLTYIDNKYDLRSNIRLVQLLQRQIAAQQRYIERKTNPIIRKSAL
ncbi:transglutaminase-like domain-containing protein [Chitinophaga sp. CB10]|uniref:transglutaminase domain-containing protein n=1 Tax=Chitinophaga sp. CB10 TaxID=1891659 RepID=UPI0025C05CB3|nr:transglutaminase-like domain-containing protein [Chitinophaga sp. CB10]